MRVNVSQTTGQSGERISIGAGPALGPVNEGDIIRAEVLSNNKGAVALKTGNGNILRAKPDTDVILSPGDKVLLEVVGKEDGILSLAIREDDTEAGTKAGGTSAETGSVKGFEDKSLAPYADKLTELKMPVSEDTVRLMSQIVAQNPGMSLDVAAFLASNKLGGDADLINAALALLAGGDKTDEMIARLLELLKQLDSQPPAVTQVPGSAAGPELQNPAAGASSAVPDKAPLMELFSLIRESLNNTQGAQGLGEVASAATTQPIIPQGHGIMQSRFVENNVENQQINVLPEGQVVSGDPTTVLRPGGIPETPEFPAPAEVPPQDVGRTTVEPQIPVSNGPQIPNPGVSSSVSPNVEYLTNTEIRILSSEPQNPQSQSPAPVAAGTGSALAEVLSGIPEFRGTPASALERFINMLYRVAIDSADGNKADIEKLEVLIERLFTRIGKNENNAGERIRNAREELFARMALIEEAASRAAPAVRTAMHEQVNRLTDHLRLLNNINQFAYMQIPVIIGEERKTAELYMFKRKGGKRADPENVNILLALDLENMGRWEALINFRNKDVSIQMEVRGEDEKNHFSENTVLLFELLAEAGFKLVNTDIKFSRQETTPLNVLSVFDRYISGRPGAVDFKV